MPEKRAKLSGIKIKFFMSSKSFAFNKRRINNLIRKTSNLFGLRKAQINIEIADDKKIIAVNKKFLKTSKVTDVISFDVSENKEKFYDIIVNAQLANRQAKLRGHSPESELALYILHGLLHQLGFDDLTPRKAAKMHRTEDQILRKHGFGVVYGSDKR
ncbi:MAG: rRNA maturation RNase YbeY [Planctomycetes bacterium GWF2_41_51]|nr:MAG: rRNA maturation RNase YbeY [Planctomycetes bacterium GWF2_41_51]